MIKPDTPFVLFLAALASLTGVSQQADARSPARMTREQQASLRCSAAFAIVAAKQAAGDEAALKYTDLTERGREYFVRSAARVMDEASLTNKAVAADIESESRWFREDPSRLAAVMPSCLILLEASGL